MADNKLVAATFEQIATMMSHLATNYSNLAATYYTMFYDTKPQDIVLQLYNDNGELKEYTIPNRAKDFTFCINGEGRPEGRIAAVVGTIYQDTEAGVLYIKKSGEGVDGWEIVGIDRDKEENVYLGEGSPIGKLSKPKGSLYVDSNEAALYIKGTSTGNEDWFLISSNIQNVPTITLSNVVEISEDSIVASKNLDNLTAEGLAVLNAKEDKSNKVTSISSSSTDIQYPTAKAVYSKLNNLDNNKADKSTTLAGYGITDANTKSEITSLLNNKANTSLSNLNTEGQAVLAAKADASDVYTKTEIDDLWEQKLNIIYPVGSIYITTNSTCPLSALVGTWELVSEDRVLQGAGTRGTVGTTLNESLPNITGDLATRSNTSNTGCFSTKTLTNSIDGASTTLGTYFSANDSNPTYQDNAPVQPDAYLVNVFRRVA